MDAWDALDDKHGVSPAEPVAAKDPWDALDQKYLKFAKSPSSTLAKPEPVDDFSGNLRFGPIDTHIPLPQVVNKALAQVGSGIADWGLAADQMMSSNTPTLGGLVTGETPDSKLRAEAADKRKRDAALNDSFMGKVFNFGGKVAPALAMPNVGGPVLTGMLAGGMTGAFEPVAGDESRGLNMGLGVGLGAVLPGGVAAFRKMGTPDAATADLARTAMDKYGIPLGMADVTQNKFVKGARSVLNDTPFIGSIGSAQNATKQGAYNRAIGQTFGADATSLTPDVMSAAKKGITGELNRVWENNTLKVDPQFVTDLASISQQAADKLNPNQAAMVEKHIKNLLSKANNAEIPGGFTNNWQSELRLSADGEKGLAQHILSELRKKTLDAFNRGVAPADAAALTKARGQYGNFKTVEPLLTKAELGVAGRTAGDVPAALLPQALNISSGSHAVGTDLGELSQIGSKFIADRTAQTGGSPRALIQNSILGSAATGGGYAGLGVGGAVGVPALAAGAQWALGSPTLTKAMLARTAAQRGLLGSPQMTPAALQALRNGLLASPAVMGPGLLGLQ